MSDGPSPFEPIEPLPPASPPTPPVPAPSGPMPPPPPPPPYAIVHAPGPGAPPPPPSATGPTPEGYIAYVEAGMEWRYAGFFARLGAFALDYLVLMAFVVPVVGLGEAAFDDPEGNLVGLLMLAGIVAYAVVYSTMTAHGGSVGHRAAGIRIVDARTGAPISAWRAFGRRLLSYLSYMACFLGFIWMTWDRRRRTWHDMMTSTVVVRVR